jgi:hypothetical protein
VVAIVAGAVLLVLSALILIVAITPGRHMAVLVVGLVIMFLDVAVLSFAVVVHKGHVSGCWTF